MSEDDINHDDVNDLWCWHSAEDLDGSDGEPIASWPDRRQMKGVVTE